LDSPPPKEPVADYLRSENRFRMLEQSEPERAEALFAQAQQDAQARRELYEYLAARPASPLIQSSHRSTS
jgi:pyruvate-ferredoxin/flavodoxin oxidoreductase